ncbi:MULTISPECIES: aspartyl-phosphate phosphatase Spo0E family protein [Paenibacillus]|uniref:Spo0E-like regulatory phosphatase n=1 Tax=Paenibacillus naphthalenovorans TaxID=162209 RepID=A0A0U2W1C8_9BACL|nr:MULTISPECIES: aspartyl-phosphate phosphatase Spo0E family protein [Paenibacillus]ALS22340.1 Spo0E-like regulatory phosphatase [Paenibacillus naphthalenovorans]NTZ16812.1 aspartyl-phosphate phosphatase Spo0E family protein [Paenibacillus sp. JMULE4]GCL70134.1 aspartyl-phosphate phosphatase Spo0E family protein [Paenibacillus naphthalenovorans]SDJ56278.1 Spo0E like sporulation regulatory protein [Paenibacillus naphthalenovorans]
MEEAELKRRMERMQRQLYVLVEKTGSFVDPKVVELSQQIDCLVLSIQLLRMKDKLQ